MSNEYEHLTVRIQAAVDKISDLEEVAQSEGEAVQVGIAPETVSILSDGLSASLKLAESSIGECRKAVPFSPLHPILDDGSDQIRWCCNHAPPHCTG